MEQSRIVVHKTLPTAGDVHNNTFLTNISEAYFQEESVHLASTCFPVVPVTKQSDFFYVWNRGDFFRDDARVRAPGTEVQRSGARLSTTAYQALVYEFGDQIEDEVRANADSPLNLDRNKTRRVMQILLIRRERIFAANFLAISKWTTDITGVAASPTSGQVLQWDAASSTPINDIEAAKRAILVNTGLEANTLVLGYDVYKALKTNSSIVDRLKYGQTPGNIATVTDSDLAQVFGIPRILVSKAIYNSAAEGATASMGFIAGKVALVCHSAPNPGLETPSGGMTFSWTGFPGASAAGTLIRTQRDTLKYKDNVDGFMSFDLKLTAADLGYFFNTIVA